MPLPCRRHADGVDASGSEYALSASPDASLRSSLSRFSLACASSFSIDLLLCLLLTRGSLVLVGERWLDPLSLHFLGPMLTDALPRPPSRPIPLIRWIIILRRAAGMVPSLTKPNREKKTEQQVSGTAWLDADAD